MQVPYCKNAQILHLITVIQFKHTARSGLIYLLYVAKLSIDASSSHSNQLIELYISLVYTLLRSLKDISEAVKLGLNSP